METPPSVPQGPPGLAGSFPAGSKCARHPEKAALYRCADCAAFTCFVCDSDVGGGAHVCPACMRQRNERAKSDVFAPARRAEPPPLPTAPPVLERPPLPGDLRCVQHSKIAAIAICDTCGAHMCGTCLFDVPGGLHLCPICAMAPKTKLSRRRATAMIVSYVLAAISSVGIAMMFTGGMAQIEEGLPNFVAVLVERFLAFFPSVAGVALSVGSLDKKLGNPAALWVAGTWNVVLAVAYLVILFYAVVQ